MAALAPIPYGYGKTSLTEIDVSDPGAMKVARELTFDGSFAAARQNGGTVRVVLNSTPLAYTQEGTADAARGWLPRSHFVSNVTGRKRTRSFVPCDRVSRPPVFSGLGMLSIVTLNLDKRPVAAGLRRRHDRRPDRLRLDEAPLRRDAALDRSRHAGDRSADAARRR